MKEKEHPTFSTTLHSGQGRWGRTVSAAQATSQGVAGGQVRKDPAKAEGCGPSEGSASWALAQTQSRKRPGTSPPRPILERPRLPQGTSCTFCHTEGNTELRVACKYWACAARRGFGIGRSLDTGFIITNESLAITPLRASKISYYQTGQGRREQEKGLLTLLEKASALRRSGWMAVREGIRSPATGVVDGCESTCGCWEPNPSRLVKQNVFLTAEASL